MKRELINTTENDRFATITELKDSKINSRTCLGISHSLDILYLQIKLKKGRTIAN